MDRKISQFAKLLVKNYGNKNTEINQKQEKFVIAILCEIQEQGLGDLLSDSVDLRTFFDSVDFNLKSGIDIQDASKQTKYSIVGAFISDVVSKEKVKQESADAMNLKSIQQTFSSLREILFHVRNVYDAYLQTFEMGPFLNGRVVKREVKAIKQEKTSILVTSFILGSLFPYVMLWGFLAYAFNISDAPSELFNPITSGALVYLIVCSVFYKKIISSIHDFIKHFTICFIGSLLILIILNSYLF